MPDIELNRIYNEDCLQGMKRIPDKSVDMILTDPPYKCDIQGGAGIAKSWDRKDWFADLEEHKEWMGECYRVLKDNSHFYCFTSAKATKKLWNDAESVGFEFKDILTVDKVCNMPVGGYYLRQTEFVLLFGKGFRKVTSQKISNIFRERFPRNEEKLHPTQKPCNLLSVYIKQSTSPQGVVLDPFMGSGTTAIACMDTDRNFIGFELSPEYCAIAERRIEQTKLKGKQIGLAF
jgi:site-specific DNA-methyltransferase (adenine-specific)